MDERKKQLGPQKCTLDREQPIQYSSANCRGTSCTNFGKAFARKIPTQYTSQHEWSNNVRRPRWCSGQTTRFTPNRTWFYPGVIASGFSHVVIEPDDATGWRVFSRISRFPPALLFNLCSILNSIHFSSAFKTSTLRVAQICPLRLHSPAITSPTLTEPPAPQSGGAPTNCATRGRKCCIKRVHLFCYCNVLVLYEKKIGAAVAQWLGLSPPTTAIRIQYPAGSLPDFRMWESCWTIPLAGGFSRGTPVSPALAFQRRSILGSHFMSCPVMTDTYGSRLESPHSILFKKCEETVNQKGQLQSPAQIGGPYHLRARVLSLTDSDCLPDLSDACRGPEVVVLPAVALPAADGTVRTAPYTARNKFVSAPPYPKRPPAFTEFNFG
ncbi:hypothetical protein PR048_023780 [Dryococelus australis]|uniref:Uncharacterized protein n=1 Tax=Dryococelus australis TaxID=614101 RepID=A0ABQ9GV43_9NEOP|nr:hypothetical protein PR048_023780 [Dryococelus australis]